MASAESSAEDTLLYSARMSFLASVTLTNVQSGIFISFCPILTYSATGTRPFSAFKRIAPPSGSWRTTSPSP